MKSKPLLPCMDTLFRCAPDSHALRILCFLADRGSARFGVLQRALGINTRMLTLRLRHLVGIGFLSRRSFRSAPPRVEYALTADGQAFCKALEGLARWTRKRPAAAR